MYHLKSMRLSKLALNTLLIILSLGAVLDASAQQNELNLSTISPIKLLNSKNGVCGSGFLFGSKIITNYHVANSVCSQSACPELQLYSSSSALNPEKNIKFSRGASAAAYDLAVIEINGTDSSFTEHTQNSASLLEKQGDFRRDLPLLSFSFPNCRELSILAGANLSSLGKLYTLTSLSLNHGSSGSPIFDKSGALFGVVSESDSFLNGLSSLLFETPFSSTRAIPLENIEELLNLDSRSIFSSQVLALNKFYIEHVLPQKGMKRIEESSRFLSKTKALALDHISDVPGTTTLLAAIDNYPFPLFTSENLGLETLGSAATRLALTASFEQFGMRSSFSSGLDKWQLQDLNNSLQLKFPAESAVFSNLIETLENSNFPGATLFLIKILLPLFLIVTALFIIWIFGLGALISNQQYGFIKKCLRIFLWSFLIFTLIAILLYLLYPNG